MSKDYYNILGVTKTASESEIKKAYRTLAHKYHPDKAGGDEAKFKEVNEAYQILSDQQKRAQYDRFGSAFNQGGGGSNGFDFSQGFGFDPSQMEDLSGMSDIFEMFFEGMGVKRRKTYERGADVETVKDITLEEAFHGKEIEIGFENFVSCATCKGLGYFEKEGFSKCASCDGRGEIRENSHTFFGQFSQVRACEKCHGQGKIPHKVCTECKGNGRKKAVRTLNIMIAPGIADGQLIKVAGAGYAGERGAGTGDLYVRIKIKPHASCKRMGDDLVVHKKIDMLDVLVGKKINIPTISGGTLAITIPEGFNMRDRFRIDGEGMPRFSSFGRGDLYVEFDVIVPEVSQKMKNELKKLVP
ncbi:MAG: DnaJ C-terminal domain-containing protein [bacterium]|nr:DnaJ C-terminal domain-containing protein [bacterium]